ncbi:MAG: EAL domain-containing protein [Deltaproteobacteria bacterium]|nr:EAL domain-containing protein [Deltaproteobacteria bacterium]
MSHTTLLDRVLAPGGIRIHFQPAYEVSGHGKRVHSLECLARGPAGTNAASANVLFEYVRLKHKEAEVDRACISAALSASRELNAPRLGINAHACTLARDPRFAEFLSTELQQNGIDPTCLTLEILEHGPALDSLSFLAAIESVRALGVRIALDDVGVGESNLRMLLDTRPDYIKLDRYFVHGASADRGRRAVLEAMALLARRLGASIVAEGVELAGDLDCVLGLGIRLIQGYVFCPALSPADLLQREPELRVQRPAA